MNVTKDIVVKQFQAAESADGYATLYVLDDRGCLWCSQDMGKNWTEVPLPQVTL